MKTHTQFADYRSFDDIETAKNLLLHVLDQNNIPYEVENTTSEMQVYTGKVSWVPPVVVKIPLASFEKANALTESNALATTVPKNHFLLSFSDNELIEILQKQDEWGMDNYGIARKILEERGKTVSPETLARYKNERIEALAKPVKVEPAWIYAAFASAVAGGILGIIFGRMIYTSTKILPNGKRVYLYDNESRKNGWLVYAIGVGFLLMYIMLGIITIT